MTMVAGRPGSQKSGFALYWTTMMGLPTLYFSADMSPFQASARIAGIRGGYTVEQVENMMIGAPEDQEAVLRCTADVPITFSFDSPIRWDNINYELEAYVELHNEYPQVVVFDNLMDFEAGASDYTAQMEILQYLDEMKTELGVTMIVLHHATDKGKSAEEPSQPPPRSEIKGGLGEKPENTLTVALDPNNLNLNVAVVKHRMGPCDPSGRSYKAIGGDPSRTTFFAL